MIFALRGVWIRSTGNFAGSGLSCRHAVSAAAARYKKKRNISRAGEELVMTGVCTSDKYNLKLLPSLVRQSDNYSLVDVHNDCRNHVTHVQERLASGEQRNAFVFKFGTAVLWGLRDSESADDIKLLIDTLLRPIEQGTSHADQDVFEDLEQMDYILSSSQGPSHVRGESLVLCKGITQNDSGMSCDSDIEIAVSHALAKSVKLSVVEGQLEHCVADCKTRLSQGGINVCSSESWSRILEVLNLDSKGNHPLVEMEDFYWERGVQETLHDRVLHVFDYRKRIHSFNQQLRCCKEFTNFHYRCSVQTKEDRHTYWIVGLIMVSIALGCLH